MTHIDIPVPLQTVDRALRILTLFTPICPELTVAQTARELDVNRSIASRLLAALEARQFVTQDPATGRFRLGVRNLDLGALYLQSQRLVTAATPYLEQLGTNEELSIRANLFVLDSGQVLRLGSYPARPLTRLRLPAQCTAAGKVLLASLSEQALEEVLAEQGLPPLTAHSITDSHALRQCLNEVRMRGYAAEAEESRLGTFCYAAPIQDVAGHTVGAVSVSYSASVQLLAEQAIRLIGAVCEAGDRISECLGSGFFWSEATPVAAATRQPSESDAVGVLT